MPAFEKSVKSAESQRVTSSRVNLYLATFIVYLGVFFIGTLYSWPSPSLPKLEEDGSWLKIDINEASWIGSLIAFGSIFGPFLGGWLVDKAGRKPTIILFVVIGVVSWVVLFVARNVMEIYVSRVIGGIAGGIAFQAAPLYVGEISEDHLRSALCSLFNFFFTAGMVFEYYVGPFVSYWALILISSVFAVLFFISCFWFPESPYFHLQRDQETTALNNMRWLRKGVPEDLVVEEVKVIQESIEENKKGAKGLMDLFASRGNRRAMLLSYSICAFQQLVGINVIIYYSQSIFQMAGSSGLSPSESAMVVGTILLIVSGASIPFIHKLGKKTMLLFSSAGMALFLALLGLYFFLLAGGHDTSSYSWLPILSLIGYVIVYSSGYGPLPWAVVAEVFPPNVKGVASALASSVNWSAGFILTKLFPILAESWGTHFVFWVFAVFSIAAFCFVLIMLPDTRGMSLLEIQDLLNGVTPQNHNETSRDVSNHR